MWDRVGNCPRDRILIEGIKFHGFHGLTRLERQVGVRLSVDLALEMDLEPAGRGDNVRATLDYRKVHARVVELGRGASHKLLESFALAVLDALLAEFPAERISIRVRKDTPVLDGIVDSVGVEMIRTRGTAGNSRGGCGAASVSRPRTACRTTRASAATCTATPIVSSSAWKVRWMPAAVS
jgi:dihydroneopterin aldolase